MNPRFITSICLAVFLVCLGLFAFFNGLYADLTGLKALSAYFYSMPVWDKVIEVIRVNDYVGYYRAYLWLDFLFIGAYLYLLIRFKKRLKEPFWIRLTVVLIVVLGASDILENVCLLDEKNWPTVSAIKMVAALLVICIVLNQYISSLSESISTMMYTVWYCRISIGVLLLMVLLLVNPQGRDLLIYTYESPYDWLYILTFSIVTGVAGVVCWYAPRFLYPENPAPGQEYRLDKVFDYSYWNNHFAEKADYASQPRLAGELNSVKESLMNQKNAVLSQVNTWSAEKYIMLQRKYVPLGLTMLFYLLLLIHFIGIMCSLGNEVGRSRVIGLIVNICILAVIALFIRLKRFRKTFYRNALRFIQGPVINLIAVGLAAGGVFLVFACSGGSVHIAEVLGQILIIIAQMLFILSISHLKQGGRFVDPRKGQLHKLILWTLMAFALAYCLYLLFGTLWFSVGLSIGLLAALFYYAIYLLFSYKGNDPRRKTYYLSTFVLLIVIAAVISTNIDNNHLDVLTRDITTDTLLTKGIAFEDYVTGFKHKLLPVDSVSREPIPVYFIAANGGGNLQAYWTASVLAYLREQSQDKIKDHIFAMSGASGGAVGLGIITQSWHIPASTIRKTVDSIYAYDYLSGGLAYLMGSDVWLSVFPGNLSHVRNRNEWLFRKYEQKLGRHLHHNGWGEEFMKIWRMNAPGQIPLFVANSTLAEMGERAYCSPISLADHKTTGFDIFKKLGREKSTLPFGQAVLLAERFPYVNSSGKIEELGHFVDGGYYDNSGMESLLELYRAASDEGLFRDSTFMPVFIHINFGSDIWAREKDPETYSKPLIAAADKSELLMPLMTVYNSTLGESVQNSVDIVEHFKLKIHKCYLPGSDVYLDHGYAHFNQEAREIFDSVHLKLVVIPLARTISKNQKNYVNSVLSIDTLPPKTHLDKIILQVKH